MKKAGHLFGRAIRETGQAMDRFGLTISGVDSFKETFSRHRPIMNLYDKVIIFYVLRKKIYIKFLINYFFRNH